MIQVTADGLQGKEAEKVVEEDITSFEAWFQKKMSAEPLVRGEVAILKTYLWYKLFEEHNASPSEAHTTEGSHGT